MPRTLSLTLLAATLGLAGCSAPTEGENMASATLSFVVGDNSGLAKSLASHVTVSSAKVMLKTIQFHSTGDDDSLDFKSEPLVVVLDLSGGLTTVGSIDIPAGEYHKVSFRLHKPDVGEDSLDADFFSVGCRAVAWLFAILILASGLSDLGVPLAAVIASLGVGGVAFALAAGPTLENLIAGVTLYLDKPVKIGQFCQFEDVLGTVERIGLRSTRIRRWGGNLVAIPNARFAEYQLDNFNDARHLWIRQRLRLRYETSPEQLSYVLAKIREMLFAHPNIVSPRARLIGFGSDALNVEIVCYSDTGVWAQWHAIREDVLLRIMEIIEASGTRLALPSKTTYVARDVGLDEERRRAAEQQVREWTEAGELPFPDMSEEQREALAGTLHFPPEGSVAHKLASEKD